MAKNSALRAFMVLLLGLLAAGGGLARALGEWVTLTDAGGLPWGTDQRPARLQRTPRGLHLPDSRFAGRDQTDRPDDFEDLDAPPGERRFLRYVDNALVDAWLLRQGPLDPTPFQVAGAESLRGATLGLNADGWFEVGDAVGWDLPGGRTAVHWRSRATPAEVLAVRAVPTGRYTAGRPKVLADDGPEATASGRVSGELKGVVKGAEHRLNGCFNNTDKPVGATISLEWDKLGRLARVKVHADQAVYDAERCVAGVVIGLPGVPGKSGSLELFRMR
jgi:hypothetical protein